MKRPISEDSPEFATIQSVEAGIKQLMIQDPQGVEQTLGGSDQHSGSSKQGYKRQKRY